MDDLYWVAKFLVAAALIVLCLAGIQSSAMNVHREWKRWRELRHHRKITGDDS